MMLTAGGITSAKGYKAYGDHVGLKRKRKDLAMVVSEQPAQVAATFTTNVAKAAPVLWNQQVVASGKPVKGILINSGQANACTGAQGTKSAELMAEKCADMLDCSSGEILLASTGVIGVQIPIETALAGIEKLAPQVGADVFSGACAAEAIMTTDTYMKTVATQIELSGKTVTIGAMAKGSGMIHPNMATMLSFIATDANISQEMLQKALSGSVSQTYNMISVDGDTSTNDMVLLLANGMAGNDLITEENEDFAVFAAALNELNIHLAKKIAADGEGATKLLAVTVKGAQCETDARKLARTVAASSLVKTAAFAADPNWGRIVAALGYAGVDFDMGKLSIGFLSENGAVEVMTRGEPTDISIGHARHVLAAGEVHIHIELGGECGASYQATAWGCDLSPDYVRINGTYRCYTQTSATDTPYAEVG